MHYDCEIAHHICDECGFLLLDVWGEEE